MIRTVLIASVAAVALAACSKPAAPTNESDVVPMAEPAATPGTPAPAATAPAKPSGPAAPVAAEAEEDNIQWAASVTEVVWLPDLNIKLFSTAGGDPAINGLYTYLAVPPENNGDGWKVFKLGDWETWKVSEQAPGRIVLDYRVSRIDSNSGDPVTEAKRMIVTFTTGENPTVTATPAT